MGYSASPLRTSFQKYFLISSSLVNPFKKDTHTVFKAPTTSVSISVETSSNPISHHLSCFSGNKSPIRTNTGQFHIEGAVTGTFHEYLFRVCAKTPRLIVNFTPSSPVSRDFWKFTIKQILSNSFMKLRPFLRKPSTFNIGSAPLRRRLKASSVFIIFFQIAVHATNHDDLVALGKQISVLFLLIFGIS